jgi:hypothetical protein
MFPEVKKGGWEGAVEMRFGQRGLSLHTKNLDKTSRLYYEVTLLTPYSQRSLPRCFRLLKLLVDRFLGSRF